MSSISNDWLFWSLKYASELNVYKKKLVDEISSNRPNGLFETNVCKTLGSFW